LNQGCYFLALPEGEDWGEGEKFRFEERWIPRKSMKYQTGTLTLPAPFDEGRGLSTLRSSIF
jgi:hypothetical protein